MGNLIKDYIIYYREILWFLAVVILSLFLLGVILEIDTNRKEKNAIEQTGNSDVIIKMVNGKEYFYDWKNKVYLNK